jgi:sulfoacetaldehyde dehydrogenase
MRISDGGKEFGAVQELKARSNAEAGHAGTDPRQAIATQIARGRAAMDEFAGVSQERLDEAVTALAWSLYRPETARSLAELAVEATGLGNVESKVIKNQRKTFGTLRDLLRVKSTGIIEDLPEKGLVKYAKPVGVVAAVTPSTNPSATPVNKAMMAVKGGNAIVIAPSPLAWTTTNATVEAMRAELKKIGAPQDLVQILSKPVTREATQALMAMADVVVVTGSQNNVRAAYSSGKPAIGVGAGNVPVIIDESADLDDAATKICASKIFDNATSCSTENSIIIPDAIYDDAIAALTRVGGYMANAGEKERIVDLLWQNGKLNRNLIAKDAVVLADAFGLAGEAKKAKFFMVEESGIGEDHPLSDEKLSLVLTVYRAKDFADAMRIGKEILDFVGKGHSIGIHTKDMDHARELAEDVDVVRVLVNQAHTFGNGGGFDNALPFTLSMGCGTWQGNSITDNLNYKCFLNITHLVTTIPEEKPTEEALFGPYWEKYGK